MTLNFICRVIAFALLLSVSGCVTGEWEVTDDSALPETGWTKNQVYQLQTRLLIYQFSDSKDFVLNFPRFAKTIAEPGSREEFHEQRDPICGDAVGALDKGTLVKFTAMRLRRNWEAGDFLRPFGQVLTGQFKDRLVELSYASLLESPHTYTDYQSVGQTSMAEIRRRDPKIFLAIEAK